MDYVRYKSEEAQPSKGQLSSINWTMLDINDIMSAIIIAYSECINWTMLDINILKL